MKNINEKIPSGNHLVPEAPDDGDGPLELAELVCDVELDVVVDGVLHDPRHEARHTRQGQRLQLVKRSVQNLDDNISFIELKRISRITIDIVLGIKPPNKHPVEKL